MRRLRDRLRELWDVTDRDEVAELINALLADADAAPYLSKHDGFDWHLHVTRPDARLAHRIGAEAAMGFLDLVREDQLGRLRRCGGGRLRQRLRRPVPQLLPAVLLGHLR